MATESRRSFNLKLAGSLMAYGLIETLFSRELFSESIRPVVQRWLAELNDLSNDLKSQQLTDLEFQEKLEELYARVNLPELVQLVELDRLESTVKYPALGAANLGIDFRKVEGLPKRLRFGKQIFAMREGRSVVPHGHVNMCTGFIILRGDFAGKHYQRVEDNKDHYLIKPTIDRRFTPGEFSTVSDHKDNVHWFKALSDRAFIFNIHVLGYDPTIRGIATRVYVDPDGEKTSGGLIVAKKISSRECHKKYG